jgi:hypothetical protein
VVPADVEAVVALQVQIVAEGLDDPISPAVNRLKRKIMLITRSSQHLGEQCCYAVLLTTCLICSIDHVHYKHPCSITLKFTGSAPTLRSM